MAKDPGFLVSCPHDDDGEDRNEVEAESESELESEGEGLGRIRPVAGRAQGRRVGWEMDSRVGQTHPVSPLSPGVLAWREKYRRRRRQQQKMKLKKYKDLGRMVTAEHERLPHSHSFGRPVPYRPPPPIQEPYRIMVYCAFPPMVANGISRCLDILLQELSRRGHMVMLITTKKHWTATEWTLPSGIVIPVGYIDHIQDILAKELIYGDPFSRSTFATYVKTWKPHLIHMIAPDAFVPAVIHTAMDQNIALVISHHTDIMSYLSIRGGIFTFLKPFVRIMLSFYYFANIVLTVSHKQRFTLKEQVDIDTHGVWKGFVDQEQFHTSFVSPERRMEMERVGVGVALGDPAGEQNGMIPEPRSFLVLHVGRLAKEKGTHLLCEVGRQLDQWNRVARKSDQKPICLAIVGEGPDDTLVSSLVDSSQYIWWSGKFERDLRLSQLYASADLFLTTSSTETCGLTTIEALASGLPVLTLANDGAPEIIKPGENGFIFDFIPKETPANLATRILNKITEIGQDQVMYDQLREHAIESAQHFTPEHSVDEVVQSYKTGLRHHGLRTKHSTEGDRICIKIHRTLCLAANYLACIVSVPYRVLGECWGPK